MRRLTPLECMMGGRWVVFAGMVVVGNLTPRMVGAQGDGAVREAPSPSQSPSARLASSMSLPLGELLPTTRPLGQPPRVAETARFARVDGTPVPSSPSLVTALADLDLDQAQLRSLFPLSAPQFPLDSVRQLDEARASAWLTRFQGNGGVIHGRSLIALAQIAMRAGQDSVARRAFDARLAELVVGRPVAAGERDALVERSLTLSAAVETFADPGQSPARLRARLPLARAYVTRLAALPSRGYRTRSDSTVVLYRQLQAVLMLLNASCALQAIPEMIAESDHLFSMIPRLGLRERSGFLEGQYPYRDMAVALISLPNGRVRLDSLDARLLALAVPRPSEFPATMAERERDEVRRSSQGAIRELMTSVALIGQPAPPILAHAWFNTFDSVYASTPRAHPWNDGRLHVVVFGTMEYDNIALLDHIQHRFPNDVEGLFVTRTDGNVGPDIKTPSEEVAWLRDFYRAVRHVSIPIAVWAGAKVPGALNTSRPAPSTVDADYHVGALRGAAVIIDGSGIIRGYESLATWEDQDHVIARLEQLRSMTSDLLKSGATSPANTAHSSSVLSTHARLLSP